MSNLWIKGGNIRGCFVLSAAILNTRFPDPSDTLKKILEPSYKINNQLKPRLLFERRFCNRIWRARLEIEWPRKFYVVGQSDNRERAEHYAYLEACSMLKVSYVRNKTRTPEPYFPGSKGRQVKKSYI